MISLLLGSIVILLAGGFAAILTSRSEKLSNFFGLSGTVSACLIALVPALQGVRGISSTFSCHWGVPGGSFSIAIDPLSGFFLIPILLLSALGAVYGKAYMHHYGARGVHWFFYNLLVAGMIMVVVARNAVLFLIAWEIMTLASYFLVTFEHDKPEVRKAGWIYLTATHIGTAFLFILFILLGSGSFEFEKFSAGEHPGLLFLLAVIGFGTKAGFMPMHVWLPEAHPVAPSHVSALMSGVMIKTGIYGLFRMLTFMEIIPEWCGWLLIGIGVSSGISGVLFALAQHNLKRLLAYHSVENIGIIALGIGTGMIGISHHSAIIAVMGFGGALLHVINHALFKGLLFLARLY